MSAWDRIARIYENNLHDVKRRLADATKVRTEREALLREASDGVEDEVLAHWTPLDEAPWAAVRYLKAAMTDLDRLKQDVAAAEQGELAVLDELRKAYEEKRLFEAFLSRKLAEERRLRDQKAEKMSGEWVLARAPEGLAVDGLA